MVVKTNCVMLVVMEIRQLLKRRFHLIQQVGLLQYPTILYISNGVMVQLYTNDNFDSLKQTILAGLADGKILEITGMYFEDEPKPDDYDNMGFARADQVAQLFKGLIPEDPIALESKSG